jgi:hypothetical protein
MKSSMNHIIGRQSRLNAETINSIRRIQNPSKRFDDGIIFISFADSAITAGDARNMFINMIIKTGSFQAQYGE